VIVRFPSALGFLQNTLAATLLACPVSSMAAGGSAAPNSMPQISSASRPNVLIIMADDLGYGDLGSYGGKNLRTPHLDTLAASGVRFTDFYVTSPRCTPSRASLLTGRYPANNGIVGLIWPEDTYGLSADRETTLATVLRENGYHTGLVGKWHLGHSQPAFLPNRNGFDYWFGMAYPNDMDGHHPRSIKMKLNWPPLSLNRNETTIETDPDLDLLTQRYTAESVDFISQNRERPWFLFYASHVPHTYLAASKEFRGKSSGGLYGDMVEEFDWSIGRVLQTLRDTGQAERTIIIFTNDNGAHHLDPEIERVQAKDPDYARIRADNSHGSNAPLRGGKNTAYEGGSRVPTFIVAPGVTRPGAVITEPANINDIVPTVATLTGTRLPADRAIDGRDLSPALRGEPYHRSDEPFFYDTTPAPRAVRLGDWKLLLPSSRWEAVQRPLELYNLKDDIGETRDLSAAHPEIVARLKALMDNFNN
jgi:arylsulfatase A-like enzyme